MIMKVVIPAAGLGTRLLFATKEQPKEMLPIFTRNAKAKLLLKPLLQVIFEQLYDAGFREFCLVVGRGKRVVEDFFTPDEAFVKYLGTKNQLELAQELNSFYTKIKSSVVLFMNQPEPKGFGNAIYTVKQFAGKEPFMVHAGDDLIVSKNNNHLTRLTNTFMKYNAEVTFCVERVNDPTRYGVISGEEVALGIYKVESVVEKPLVPPSNLAIVAIYILTPAIFQAIEDTQPDQNGETQLTDAIMNLTRQKRGVYAVELNQSEKRIDVGTPESYWKALTLTYDFLGYRGPEAD
jgi:UTP--glucose-1-phosphate uridylyltransferase